MRLLWRGQAPDGLRACDRLSRPTYQIPAFLLRSRNEPLSGPSGPVTKLPPCCCNNRQARASWSPVLASKLKEAGIRPCPSYSSRSTPGDQGRAGHEAPCKRELAGKRPTDGGAVQCPRIRISRVRFVVEGVGNFFNLRNCQPHLDCTDAGATATGTSTRG